jgi:hypothetical protein
MKYSYDGATYQTAFSTTLTNPTSSYNELILSGTTWATAGSYTDYDYITITSRDTTEFQINFTTFIRGNSIIGPPQARCGAGDKSTSPPTTVPPTPTRPRFGLGNSSP